MRKNKCQFWFCRCVMTILLVSCQTITPEQKTDYYSQIPPRPEVKEVLNEVDQFCQYQKKDPQKSIDKILDTIINFHPNPEVRNLEKLFYGEIILVYGDLKGPDAGFSVWSANNLPASFKPRQAKKFYPVIQINPVLMICPLDEEIIMAVYFALDHEFLHYKQYINYDAGEKKLFMSLNRRMQGQNRPLPSEACELLWSKEKEATERTCNLINAWQLDPELTNGFCRFKNEDEFKKTLYDAFTKKYFVILTECHEVWRKDLKEGDNGK